MHYFELLLKWNKGGYKKPPFCNTNDTSIRVAKNSNNWSDNLVELSSAIDFITFDIGIDQRPLASFGELDIALADLTTL